MRPTHGISLITALLQVSPGNPTRTGTSVYMGSEGNVKLVGSSDPKQ